MFVPFVPALVPAKVRKQCTPQPETAQDSPEWDRGTAATVEHTHCSQQIDVAPPIQVVDVFQDRHNADRRTDECASFVGQLSVIREMLRTLDTWTIAGQHHVMDKVVTFVEGQVQQTAGHVSKRNRATLADVTTQLRSESDRRVPDATRFAQRAESLIRLLVAIDGNELAEFPGLRAPSHVEP